MLSKQSLDEIRVYEDVAERTGAHFDRSAVRRSDGYCRSLTEFMRKARASGDGTFYLPPDLWPADAERLELRKPWIVMSSIG
jgi:hypothetical protein